MLCSVDSVDSRFCLAVFGGGSSHSHAKDTFKRRYKTTHKKNMHANQSYHLRPETPEQVNYA